MNIIRNSNLVELEDYIDDCPISNINDILHHVSTGYISIALWPLYGQYIHGELSGIALRLVKALIEEDILDSITIGIACIPLRDMDAYEAIELLGYRAPQFLASRVPDNMVHKLQGLRLSIAVSREGYTPSSDDILYKLNRISTSSDDEDYYTILDKYLEKNNMTEIEFLRKYDPSNRRLRNLISIVEYTGRIMDCRNEATLLADPMNKIPPFMILNVDGYCLSAGDVYNMSTQRLLDNPYNREPINKRDMESFLANLLKNSYPVSRDSGFDEVPTTTPVIASHGLISEIIDESMDNIYDTAYSLYPEAVITILSIDDLYPDHYGDVMDAISYGTYMEVDTVDYLLNTMRSHPDEQRFRNYIADFVDINE